MFVGGKKKRKVDGSPTTKPYCHFPFTDFATNPGVFLNTGHQDSAEPM